MVLDPDKNHPFHPTTSYNVQVGYNELYATFCKMSRWPYASYPCLRTQVRYDYYTEIAPVEDVTAIDESKMWEMGQVFAGLFCDPEDSTTNLCSEDMHDIKDGLGLFDMYLPYQRISIPIRQPATYYYWSVGTVNDVGYSFLTLPSKVLRSL